MDFASTSFEPNPNWFVVVTLTVIGIASLVFSSLIHRKRHWPLVRVIGVIAAAVCFWFVLGEFEVPPW